MVENHFLRFRSHENRRENINENTKESIEIFSIPTTFFENH